MKRIKYLITGGAGFIGSEISNLLGENVLVVDNLSSGKRNNLNKNVLFEKVDICSREAVRKIFKKYNPQKVCHLASQTNASNSIMDPNTDAVTNIVGSINILTEAANFNCEKIVFSSSAAVYGDANNEIVDEKSLLNPINPYGISKLAVENYIQYFYKQFGLKYSILRYSNVYGPNQRTDSEGGVVSIFINNAKRNKDLVVFGDGNQSRDFIFVKDVVRATISALDNKNVGIFNVSTGVKNTLNNLIEIIKNKSNSTSKVIYKPKRLGDIEISCLSNEKIKKEFNWSPTFDIQLGIDEMLLN
jgi:UDP-glucose 4-epimerase